MPRTWPRGRFLEALAPVPPACAQTGSFRAEVIPSGRRADRGADSTATRYRSGDPCTGPLRARKPGLVRRHSRHLDHPCPGNFVDLPLRPRPIVNLAQPQPTRGRFPAHPGPPVDPRIVTANVLLNGGNVRIENAHGLGGGKRNGDAKVRERFADPEGLLDDRRVVRRGLRFECVHVAVAAPHRDEVQVPVMAAGAERTVKGATGVDLAVVQRHLDELVACQRSVDEETDVVAGPLRGAAAGFHAVDKRIDARSEEPPSPCVSSRNSRISDVGFAKHFIVSAPDS